jgi:hypothetical protein
MRIEARGNKIKYLLDGQFLIEATDSTFASGQCGIGYTMHFNGGYPAGRGALFDNFIADTLDVTPPRFGVSLQPDGKVHLTLSGDVGSTSAVERATSLNLLDWTFYTNIVNSNATEEFLDVTNAPTRFYRARRLQ